LIFFFALKTANHQSNKKRIKNAPEGKPNILLITLDTTRADHLSCYGYNRLTTPNLDKFARAAVLYKNAYATAPWTLPSHASIFTGMYPTKHGADYNVTHAQIACYLSEKQKGKKFDIEELHNRSISPLSKGNRTLAEILSERGYRTAGIIGSPYCATVYGISRGFDYYDETFLYVGDDITFYLVYQVANLFFPLNDLFTRYGYLHKRVASQLNKAAFEWLGKNHHQPFFLFLNYFDAHYPYLPPPPYNSLFGRGDRGLIKSLNPRGGASYLVATWNLIQSVLSANIRLTPKEKELLISQYDGELCYLDHNLGLLFDRLKALNAYDNTLIIITSDHGESFGEHGLVLHMPALYEELIRIPLIIKYPFTSARHDVVEQQVSLVDLLPTLLSYLDYPIPSGIDGSILGASKRPLISESNTSLAYVDFGEKFRRSLKAIYQGREKYIWASDSKHALYDLSNDPGEERNLFQSLPSKAESMANALNLWLASFKPPGTAGGKVIISRSQAEALRSLGYAR
jgi:arylsulfatase A-like enzyme